MSAINKLDHNALTENFIARRMDIWSRLVCMQVVAEASRVVTNRRTDVGLVLGRVINRLESQGTRDVAIGLVRENLHPVSQIFTEPQRELLSFYRNQLGKRAAQVQNGRINPIPGVKFDREVIDPMQVGLVRDAQSDLMFDMATASTTTIVLSLSTGGQQREVIGFSPYKVGADRDFSYAAVEERGFRSLLVAA